MDAFLGTILPWPISYAPRGWVFCDGSALPINQYTALFALISTQYGGDGKTNFKVPDLRGRTILGTNGQTPLSNHPLAFTGGAEQATVNAAGAASVTLTTANLPSHTHSATLAPGGLTAKTAISVSTGTNGQLPATQDATLSATASGASGAAIYLPAGTAQTTPVTLGGVTTTIGGGGAVTVGNTGNGAPVDVNVTVPVVTPTMPPYMALNYIICVEGIYPSRP